MLKIARFDCPHECGIIDMTFEQIRDHVKNECDLRDFEKKQDIIDQCVNLQERINENMPNYERRIYEMEK